MDHFLSDYEAESIIDLAKDLVRTSLVGTEESGILESATRTSRNTWVNRHASNITNTLALRAADVLGLDERILVNTENSEDLQVVHYVNGQKYDPHTDWGAGGHAEERFITMLLYLTDQVDSTAGGKAL